jgi:hypothetical protein
MSCHFPGVQDIIEHLLASSHSLRERSLFETVPLELVNVACYDNSTTYSFAAYFYRPVVVDNYRYLRQG